MLGTEPIVWSYVSSGSRRSHRGTRLLKPPDLRRGNKTSPRHPGTRAFGNLRLERFQTVCLFYGVPVAPRHRIRRSHGTLPGPRAHREGPGSLRATRGLFSQATSAPPTFRGRTKCPAGVRSATPRGYERPKRCPPWMRRRGICRGVQGKGLGGYSQIFRNPATCRADVEHRT